MNSITAPLAFEGITFQPVQRRDQVWLRAAEIAQALGYAREDSVSRICERNKDEFSPSMSLTVKLTVKGFGSGNSKKEVRLFSLRGAHLIAMFARTPVAKTFRRWVLDILDREVQADSAKGKRLDEVTKHNLEGLCTHMEFLRSWWNAFGPAIRDLAPDVACRIHDHFIDGVCFSRNVARTAGIKVNPRIASYPWRADSHERSKYLVRGDSV